MRTPARPRRRLLIPMDVLMILGSVALFAPLSPATNIFRAVDASTDTFGSVSSGHHHQTHTWLPGDDHAVVGGRLFLRVQSTRPAALIVTYVDQRLWTAPDIAEYRTQHPELEALWPDPAAADGGVASLRDAR